MEGGGPKGGYRKKTGEGRKRERNGMEGTERRQEKGEKEGKKWHGGYRKKTGERRKRERNGMKLDINKENVCKNRENKK
ncbi:hypothetical protein Pmani_034901 [Petrolisthes manimaculis]|uniref:Uncharacterized protein n=1 Tax=Petrolisthes manimaculis TaxID=1843537 RepID=A0AAE1TR22_9EUCA|nr:hypothetical protein Pmani_034901 [Petrolisthes manimaculis]